jgi:Zn finger protein HypA/HybF involved in hydrogenase expression
MAGCDFFLVVSQVLVLFTLVSAGVCDRASSYGRCRRKLFWCKKCDEFYLADQRIESCECPRCRSQNTKLTF